MFCPDAGGPLFFKKKDFLKTVHPRSGMIDMPFGTYIRTLIWPFVSHGARFAESQVGDLEGLRRDRRRFLNFFGAAPKKIQGG